METLLAFAFVVFLIWIATKGRKATPAPPPRAATSTRPRSATQVAASNVATSVSRSVTSEQCWVPPGQERTIAGYAIPGGMIYVGSGLPSITGVRVEPALIDPSLPVKKSNADRGGASMTYWPSYGSIAPECRAAYLEWLSTGRRDPSAYIGYVFLYFYGLERRALADARQFAHAKADLPAITAEVQQLLRTYGSNGSFRRYGTQFLDVLTMLSERSEAVEPPTERFGNELPIALRVGIGQLVASGKPIPADWALSWFVTHPEVAARTPIPLRRCPQEFGELFRNRYATRYGDGMTLKPNRSKVRMAITPASASFGGKVDVSADLPDIGALTTPFAKLREIGESCAADLDAFSRWVGRNADAPRTIAAVALLPPELATTHDSSEARGLWDWVRKTVGSRELAAIDTDDLLLHCASFGHGKLAKSEAVLLAQLLEKGSYGVEPDVRFGGAPLAPGGTAVLFKLPAGASAIASPQYAAATVLLHLAVAISAADGSISPSEEQHLQEHMQRALALSDAERLRLSAHLAWLMKAPPVLTGVKKRLEPLDQRQRSVIGDFIIGVAGADGQISPDEIRTLGKVYPMLGLDADDVYSHVHAMAAGAATVVEGNEPVRVIAAQPSAGFAIPSRSAPAQAVHLDMAAVNAKLAESAKISAILDDIFTEEEPPTVLPPNTPQSPTSRVPSAHGALLARLVERTQWSRAEFEALAADCRILPDGAIDTINEAAFDHTGGPVLEGEDPIQIDVVAAKELMI